MPDPLRRLARPGRVQGDFGYSIQSRRPIAEEIGKRIPPTLVLMGTAIVDRDHVGVPFGIISALRQYSKLDYILTTITMLHEQHADLRAGPRRAFTSSPCGWTSFPAAACGRSGRAGVGPGLPLAHDPAGPGARARRRRTALRYTRASMLEVLNSDYVTTAKAKGLARGTVVIRHAFRNSLIPIITVIGLLLPELVAGAVITEQIFAWPGMGQLAVRAARDRDPALMMGVVLVVGIAVLVTTSWSMSSTPESTRGSALAAHTDFADAKPLDAKQVVTTEHVSLTRAAFRRFIRHRLAVIGSIILLLIVFGALLAEVISSRPFFTDVKAVNQAPSPAHICSAPTGRVATSGRASSTGRGPRWRSDSARSRSTSRSARSSAGSPGMLGGWVDNVIMRATDT